MRVRHGPASLPQRAQHLRTLAVRSRSFDDEPAAGRYLDHDIVNQLQLAEQRDLAGLTGSRLKAARHRQDKELKRLRPLADELVERYGKGYRRSWTDDSVRTRAERAGRLREYAYYRYASGVAHGSVSGSDGSVLRYGTAEGTGKVPVYRLGGNLYFCVQALNYGLTSFRRFVSDTQRRGISSADAVLHRLARLEEQLEPFESEMFQLHHAISPEEAPPPMNTVALLHPTGVHELFLHDVVGRRVIRARATNPIRVRDQIRRTREESPYSHITQTVWLTDEPASPIPGEDWESDERIATEKPPFIPRPGARIATPHGAFGINDDLQPYRLDD